MSETGRKATLSEMIAIGKLLTKKDMEELNKRHKVGYSRYRDHGDRLLSSIAAAEEGDPNAVIEGDLLRSLLRGIGRDDLISLVGKETVISCRKVGEFTTLTEGFAAREIENLMIKKFLAVKEKSSFTKYYALVGKNGLGKTQLSIRYCELMSHVYATECALCGDGLEKFSDSMEDLLTRMEIEYKGASMMTRKELLVSKLNRKGNWLLVVNNFRGMVLQDMKDRIPSMGGTVLITCEECKELPPQNVIKMTPMTINESHKLLGNVIGVRGLSLELVEQIGKVLDYNALSLSLFAHHMNRTKKCSSDQNTSEEDAGIKFLNEVTSELKEIEAILSERQDRTDTSNAAANLLHLRILEKMVIEEPTAMDLTYTISILDPDGVGEEVLRGIDEDYLGKLKVIERLGLVERKEVEYYSGKKYCMNRELMNSLQEQIWKMSTGEVKPNTHIFEQAVAVLYRIYYWNGGGNDSSPLWDVEKIRLKMEMGAHAEALAVHEYHLLDREWRDPLVEMLRDFIFYTIEVMRGEHVVVERRLTNAEKISVGGYSRFDARTSTNAPGNMDTSSAAAQDTQDHGLERGYCSNGVRAALSSVRGDLKGDQGKYEEAISHYRSGIEMEEDESRKSSYYNNIGICLEELGRYDDAVKEYENSLRIDSKYEGEDSIGVGSTLDNMGLCLAQLGMYEEALELHDIALEIYTSKSKSDPSNPANEPPALNGIAEVNPLIALSYVYMGDCYIKMGLGEEALKIHMKSLSMFRQVYSPAQDHPDIAKGLYDVSLDLVDLGREEEARENLDEAYEMQMRMLGAEHPDTMETRELLDYLYRNNGEEGVNWDLDLLIL